MNLIAIYKRELLVVLLSFAVLVVLGQFADAFAWNSLVTSTDFDGIKTDVVTAATGIITICIVVLGVWLIVKAMSH